MLLRLAHQNLKFELSMHRFEIPRAPHSAGLCVVRPAWAHSCGCVSRRKLITANEAKRNCTGVTECGKEAWSEAASR